MLTLLIEALVLVFLLKAVVDEDASVLSALVLTLGYSLL